MHIKITAFGIAKDIIKNKDVALTLSNKIKTIGDLKVFLSSRYIDFEQLKYFKLAVNDEYRDDDYTLNESDEVVIIPPVSGG